jgi:hypothetical protein
MLFSADDLLQTDTVCAGQDNGFGFGVAVVVVAATVFEHNNRRAAVASTIAVGVQSQYHQR